ncbi:hypothetical protein BaRGS_00017000 [Batillaria attramentaria]|uniref:Uncharacterized protein n=1 Tax=Batillaria attramentaria TaxID=370345 RepID=A0ABD0KWX3_9CAEN
MKVCPTAAQFACRSKRGRRTALPVQRRTSSIKITAVLQQANSLNVSHNTAQRRSQGESSGQRGGENLAKTWSVIEAAY